LFQQIRLEQDAALQESLRQDQEKERKKREEEERKRREEEEERRIIEEAAQKKETLRRMKIDLANLIPEEPGWQKCCGCNNTCSMLILSKFSDTKRLIKKDLHHLKCNIGFHF
jgi:hypothetical protein